MEQQNLTYEEEEESVICQIEIDFRQKSFKTVQVDLKRKF